MTIDIKTIAARMTDEEVRVICASLLLYANDDDFVFSLVREDTHDIYTRLTTPQPQPDDAVTGEDVRVCEYSEGHWRIRCGSWDWSAAVGWHPGMSLFGWSNKDDAIAQRDRLVARGELPTVNGRVATRKECGLA